MSASQMVATAPGIVVHGNVAGSIQYGDHNIQVNDNHGTVVVERVTATRNRRPRAVAPRAPDPFVARSAQLQRLAAAIGARRAITVSGASGAGRTALLHAAANLPNSTLPDGVLRLDGVDDTGTALTLGDLAQRLHDLAWDCVPAAKVSLESARTQLGAIEALGIIDDVRLPGRDLERLADLLPAGAVLIAVAEAPFEGDLDDLPVGALERSEAVALLSARGGLDSAHEPEASSQASLDDACGLLSDWPEALVIAGRAMAVNHLSPAAAHEALAAVTPSAALPHEIALERAWALARPGLGDNARRLLVAASVLPGRKHDPALLRRTLGDPEWFGQAADTLQALGLLTLNSPRYRVPDGIRDLLSHEADSIEADDIRDRHVDVAIEAAKEHALDPGFVPSEIGSLLGAFDHAKRRGRLEDMVRLGRLISPQLTLHGLWDAWERVASDVGRAAERLGWTVDVAWSAHELGTRALALGQRQVAQQALEQALRLRQEVGDEEGAAYTKHNLARLGHPSSWWDTLRRYLPGGAALVVALLILGLIGPPVAGFVQKWIRPADPQESPAPTDAPATATPAPSTAESPSPSTVVSPPPSESPDPLLYSPELGLYELEGRDWTTTLQITLTGGRGDYLIDLGRFGERRESTSTFELSGQDCERYTVTGTASSAGEQTIPISVPVGPSVCPSLPPVVDVACVTFDDLDIGRTFGEAVGQKPAELVHKTPEGVRVYVDLFRDSEVETFGSAEIREPSDAFGSGQYMFFNNLTMWFNFDELPFEPRRVDFAFDHQNGVHNFSVNDSVVHVGHLLEAPKSIDGVSWGYVGSDPAFVGTLDGTVGQFRIGGPGLSLDTVCAHR